MVVPLDMDAGLAEPIVEYFYQLLRTQSRSNWNWLRLNIYHLFFNDLLKRQNNMSIKDAHGGGPLSIVVRLIVILSLVSCLHPSAGHARGLQQPASVLPLAKAKELALPKVAKKRVITAPEAEEVPQWLLQATKPQAKANKIAQPAQVTKKAKQVKSLTVEEIDSYLSLGNIRANSHKADGVQPTKKFRPQIKSQSPQLEGPVLRIPGLPQSKTIRSAKRG